MKSGWEMLRETAADPFMMGSLSVLVISTVRVLGAVEVWVR